MCGRFALRAPLHQLIDQFLLSPSPDLATQPRFNIAPTQPVMAIRQRSTNEHRELAAFHWGLIPSWSRDASSGQRLINARSETVASKPSFREAFRQQRCAILTDGYFEWQREGRRKQPYFFHRTDHQPFAFAGLWECWNDPRNGTRIESTTILTMEADETTRPIHHRMPVILDEKLLAPWLDPGTNDVQVLQSLLSENTPGLIVADRVRTRVNNPRHDDAACLEAPRELF